jgi:cytochrome c biogenesis protein
MRPVLKFFSSVKLAIALIILITLASIVGTLIPQGGAEADYAARYGALAKPLIALQITRLYQSVWYLVLLLLFGVNTVVCTLSRFGAKWRRAFGPPPTPDAQALAALKVRARFRLDLSAAAARDRVAGALASHGYRTTGAAGSGGLSLTARKRRFGWFGSDVVHIGLLIILAGGLTSGRLARRADLALFEGQALAVPGAGFDLRLDKFETEYYPQGGVKDWKSTVTVVENGAPVLTRTVEVNHPLSHRGYSVYQESYGRNWDGPTLTLELRKRADAAFVKPVTLKAGGAVAVDDTDVDRIAVRQFVPDFVIGEGNRVQSRSQEPRNPAAFVEATMAGKRVFAGWVFANHPEFGQGHGANASPVTVVLKDYRAESFSVLRAAKDPGANFIWLGCLFVMAGLFLAFSWPPREIQVAVEGAGDKVEVTAGGLAAKGREAFQAEFDQIVEHIRRPS